MSSSENEYAILEEEEGELPFGVWSFPSNHSVTADCLICQTSVVSISDEQGETSNKCPKCLIPSGFLFKCQSELEPNFECAICHCIIKDATELSSCHHLMCAECLLYYEQEHRKSQQG